MVPTTPRGGVLERIRQRKARESATVDVGRASPVALCYPSPYRVGMSSLGYQTLYRQLNTDGPGAHRAFLPDAWERQSLSWPQAKRPILAYESERPVSEYPILAFSVAYELELTGVVRFLEGSGIPLLAADRGARDPIVIAGGPLTGANPSALLPLVDLLLCGEGESLLPEVLEILLAGGSRDQRVRSAAKLEHVAIGELERGVFAKLPTCAQAHADRLPAHAAITTVDTELSNMFLIEPERGCSRSCTFCVMRGPTTGGMRLVDLERTLSLIPEHAKKVGLVGAAVTDHPDLEALVERIVASDRGVGISSLRADRLTPAFLKSMRRGGYRTITVASDGISARMRRLLSRRITEEHLLRAAELIHDGGFHRMKLYQMIGVPGETDEDVDEMVRFNLELAKIMRLTLTISTFVAKRNTPLDGSEFIGTKRAEERLRRIRRGLKDKVELRPQPPKWAEIEYRLAQGGPQAGHAAIAAVHAGGGYRAWIDAFREHPSGPRTPRYGDEELRAGRRGHAAARPRLPVISDT